MYVCADLLSRFTILGYDVHNSDSRLAQETCFGFGYPWIAPREADTCRAELAALILGSIKIIKASSFDTCCVSKAQTLVRLNRVRLFNAMDQHLPYQLPSPSFNSPTGVGTTTEAKALPPQRLEHEAPFSVLTLRGAEASINEESNRSSHCRSSQYTADFRYASPRCSCGD